MVSRRGVVPRPDGGMRGAAARRPEGGRRRRAALAAAIGPTPRGRWQRLTVAEAFSPICRHRSAGDRARSAAPGCGAARRRGERRIGIAPHPGDDWETLFFRIFLERIEPHLGIGAPTILYDYPVSMAALSRRKPDDPRLAERFELYVCGLELANAFGELTDPVEQRAPLSRRPGAQAGALRRDLSDRRGFPRGARSRPAGLRRHRARLRPARHARDRGGSHRGGAVGAGDVIGDAGAVNGRRLGGGVPARPAPSPRPRRRCTSRRRRDSRSSPPAG